MPLGSGAIAGHPFGLDRAALARDLGFAAPCTNSMDAVSDRDFVLEYLFAATTSQVHLSRFAEDLIIYSSNEFGFVRLSDAYATGSSLMPQKKNPDALELLRGKAGRLLGQLTGLLASVKGTPSTYNKDLQEDKEPLFDAADTWADGTRIANGVVATLMPRPDRMRAALSADMLATDLADFLVRRGVPFREAHHHSGRAVQLAEERECALSDLTAQDLGEGVHELFLEPAADGVGGHSVDALWDFETSVDSRDAAGGTSRRAVLEQVETLRAWLAEEQAALAVDAAAADE